ncbi:MarR family winged helix-turn-helix transcriptional regulator [Kribbella deserti]|uniref:MarR family winged helix-turn-helix transcriptional regulator n=1 Tax=Kribbella deserti TaxID=1926257 RepID=A0ABV6QKH8_9ACTN
MTGSPSSGASAAGAVAGESAELVGLIEQELSLLLRRSRSTSMSLARKVHPDMDAAGYALVSQIDLGTASGRAGVRASDVALALGLDKSTVSRGITQLEGLGLVERISDPNDGRARLLRLTATGAERFGAIRRQRRAEFEGILSRWRGEDLSALATLLTRLNADFS